MGVKSQDRTLDGLPAEGGAHHRGGRSSGIGLATAKLLAARGAHVWLIARNRVRLEAALDEAALAGSGDLQRCGIVAADVADAGQSLAAVCGFSEALSLELKPAGVSVSVVFPCDTETPQLAAERPLRPRGVEILNGGRALSPESVAQAIVDGISRRRFLIVPSAEGSLYYWLSGFAGSLQYPIMDFLADRARRQARNWPGKWREMARH